MRKKQRQITDQQRIEEILHTTPICLLAMNDEDGPYVTPMNFGFHQGRLYLHGAPAGKRLECLRRDPRVGFCVVASSSLIASGACCDFTTHYESVVGKGRVRILTDVEEKTAGLRLIMADHGRPDATFEANHLAAAVVFELTITEMTGKRNPPAGG